MNMGLQYFSILPIFTTVKAKDAGCPRIVEIKQRVLQEKILKDKAALDNQVVWQDGMLLSSGHMKHLSERMENLAFYHAKTPVPFHWGVRQIQSDDNQIEDGNFSLTAIDAVLPDGKVLQYTGDGQSISISLPAEEAESDICVGLLDPRESPHEDFVEYLDKYSDADAQPITLCKNRPVLSVIKNGEVLGNRIMLAQIKYLHGQFTLGKYYPPALQINKGSMQWEYVETLISGIRKKAKHLAKVHQETRPSNMEYRLERRFMVHALTAGLLTADAVLKAGSHPYHIYLSLCNILGQMAVLREDILPPVLHPFNHLNSYSSFREVGTHISLVLEGLSNNRYSIHVFDCQNGVYRLVMQKVWLGRSLILAIKAENQEQHLEVISWMMDCLIGNAEQLKKIKRTRTLGARRSFIKDPPSYLHQPDKVFFSIDPQDLQAGDELLITNHIGRAPAPERIELYFGEEQDLP